MTTESIRASRNKLADRAREVLQRANGNKAVVGDLLVHILGQVRVLRKAYPGLMHLLIFWGVSFQIVGTIINIMQMGLFFPFIESEFLQGTVYLVYELTMDLAGVAILLGVLMAAMRRFVLRPKTLETRWDDIYALVLLASIPLVGFTMEALRLVSTNPPWAAWSPVGNIIADGLRAAGLRPETAASTHPYFFWTHFILGLTLFASIPFTKLRHLFLTPLNILTRPHRPASSLQKIENLEEAEVLGVGKIQEFSSWQLLSFDACLRCGRCEEVCPATNSGMPYSPRQLIQRLRQITHETLITPNGKPNTELSEALSEAMLWSCTTCGACVSLCPAFVNPIDEIVDLRRYATLTTGKLPKSAADALRNFERQGNPWGMPAEDRTLWAEGLGVRELSPGDETDVLLFLGCAFAYDERNKKVAQAFVRLLQSFGVDFGILGMDETCCGETARRLGHEYLFQVFAEQNIQMLNQIKFKRIVTQCPHCYNTLKNEYPQMGGNFRVLHYTELLQELEIPWSILDRDGRGSFQKVTYHDSCYLGRYNQIYEAPRKLLHLAKVPIKEMPRHHANSFCCGGGGGQMWLETDAETRINHRRLQDALSIQVETVATACPYCLLMFDDAIRSKGLGERIQVMDIAEILERQLAQPKEVRSEHVLEN